MAASHPRGGHSCIRNGVLRIVAMGKMVCSVPIEAVSRTISVSSVIIVDYLRSQHSQYETILREPTRSGGKDLPQSCTNTNTIAQYRLLSITFRLRMTRRRITRSHYSVQNRHSRV